jgi:hypothetical protein
MKVCEACSGQGFSSATLSGRPVRVQCGTCLGTGLINLGHESALKYRILRERAQAKAVREGWYIRVWDGAPGEAKQVLRPVTADERQSA